MVGGSRSAGLLGGSLNVKSYEILAIDDERPHVGILVARDGALWLASSDTVQLAAAPNDLQSEAGAKVWIIGQSTGRRLHCSRSMGHVQQVEYGTCPARSSSPQRGREVSSPGFAPHRGC